MFFYADLEQTRRYLSLTLGADVSDDDKIFELIARASGAIRKFTRRDFHPSRKTLYYDTPADRTVLHVRNFDILELKGLSDKAGTRNFDVTAIQLLTGCDQNLYPKDRLVVNRDSGSTFNYSGVSLSQIHVDAVLGYHEDYDNAWIDTGASLAADTGSAASIIGMGLSSGRDTWYLTPRYAAGTTLRIGSEYMVITGFNSGSDVIVKRALYGTSAASYASGIQIDRFDYEDDVAFCTQRLAAFTYQQESNPFGNRLVAPQFGTIEIPEEWPPDVKAKLGRFVKGRTISRLF